VSWPWVTPETTDADRQRILGPASTRVHLIEYPWLQRILTAQGFIYRIDVAEFEPYGDELNPHSLSPGIRCVRWDPPNRSATCWHCMRPPRSSFGSHTPYGPGGMP